MRRLLSALFVATALGAFAGEATARTVVLRDDQGRSMRFDVRTANVDVEAYADILRAAAHGNEIRRVTVRIVAAAQVARTCGRGAGGCYAGRAGRGLIVVPGGDGSPPVHTLLHEYAHHLDRSRGVRGVREPNGTAHWWRARGMAHLLGQRRVAFDYSRGWSRAISEIFAEDYVQLHFRLPYKIGWLSRPRGAVRAAVRRDVAGVPAASALPPPVVVERSGTLAPGQQRVVRFGLLGPGRRVTFSAEVGGESTIGVRARLTLRCGRRSVTRELTEGEVEETIDEPNLGPAPACRAVLTSTSASPRRFVLRVELAIER